MPVLTTLATARNELRRRLDESAAGVYPADTLNSFLNIGCERVAENLGNVRKKDRLAYPVASASVSLPATFISVRTAEWYSNADTDNLYSLDVTTPEQMISLQGPNRSVQGIPAYAIVDESDGDVASLSLYPLPLEAGVVLLRYYGMPTTMSADGDLIDLPAPYRELAVKEAEILAYHRRNRPGIDELRDELKEAYQLARHRNYYRESNSRPRIKNTWLRGAHRGTR